MVTSTDRTHYRALVAEIAAKAKEKLPAAVNGRVESATKLVLAGDVTFLDDGTVQVGSSDPTRYYRLVGSTCTCTDFTQERAPEGWCKHRIAAGIQKRVQEMLPQSSRVETEASPEVPTCIDLRFLTYLHGKPFIKYTGLLAIAHTKGLVSLKAHFISVTQELALAEAEATFADGQTYSECADSTPQNVPAHIRPHYPRMALTRAKARALRDALNVAMVAVEELEGGD
jgi:hypothetical protein